MNPIVLAVLIVAGLALAAGLILAVASVVMAVPRDEKAEALRAVLPGANCGACGYSGCDGYAKAMAHEGAKVGLCSPGGAAVAEATANLLGVEGTLEAKTALVHCGGCEEFAARKLRYSGLPSCAAAAQFYGGDLACSYGCQMCIRDRDGTVSEPAGDVRLCRKGRPDGAAGRRGGPDPFSVQRLPGQGLRAQRLAVPDRADRRLPRCV